MIGIQLWRRYGWPYTAPVGRRHAAKGGWSWRYYQRIDALTAQGVKFP